MLGCDWRGAGDYVGTNLKFNTLVFRCFFKSGFLHVFKSPELRIIEIQDGDATCGNIDAPDHVKVFLSTELCKKHQDDDTSAVSSSSSSSSPSSTSSSSPSTSADNADSSHSEMKTTVTLEVQTTSNVAYPHIQIFFEKLHVLEITVIVLSGRPDLIPCLKDLTISCLKDSKDFLMDELVPDPISDLLFEKRAIDIFTHDKLTETNRRRQQTEVAKYLEGEIIEVMCFYSAKDTEIKDAVETVTGFFLETSDGYLHLKDDGDYYHQIQGQLYINKKKCCDLIVWIPTDLAIIRIVKDINWSANIEKLIDFYFRSFISEVNKK
uniref:Uncharacterized protein n=1 Tax=Magallana gigas TaxID=29159 RepID=A0A8W8NZ28_MAGGI